MTAMTDAGQALLLAIIALVISGLAAGFSAWQAITSHRDRLSRTEVRFVLTRKPGQKVNAAWGLDNSGGGSAIGPRVVVSYGKEGWTLEGTVSGAVHGHSFAELKLRESWPTPNYVLEDRPNLRWWDLVTATVTYETPSGRRKTKRIPIRP